MPIFFPLFSTQLSARFFEKINLIRSLCGSKSSLSPSVLKMAYKPTPPIISLILFPVLPTSHSITTTLASLFLEGTSQACLRLEQLPWLFLCPRGSSPYLLKTLAQSHLLSAAHSDHPATNSSIFLPTLLIPLVLFCLFFP